jgi:hypothetical protein
MTQIATIIRIKRPIDAVYEYVTTPASWPEWHPASRSVSGAVDHSLTVGEEVTEAFVAAGRPGQCVWRVTERQAPRLWTITTSTPQIDATIAYRLSADAGETVFERDITYAPATLWFRILDRLVLRRRMEHESRAALFAAKKMLER